jgi:hypothetical protein
LPLLSSSKLGAWHVVAVEDRPGVLGTEGDLLRVRGEITGEVVLEVRGPRVAWLSGPERLEAYLGSGVVGAGGRRRSVRRAARGVAVLDL